MMPFVVLILYKLVWQG